MIVTIKIVTFKLYLHTFRHWKAATEYAKTKDILSIMRLLGHKKIENTLIHTHLVTFKDDEYRCEAALTVREASQLIEAGFEYVTTIENT